MSKEVKIIVCIYVCVCVRERDDGRNIAYTQVF